jgi:uncharacterized protein (TIGR00299 family) protein
VTSDAPTPPEVPATGRVAWFHCYAGIAGDMALGSLVDAGAPAEELFALLRRLPLGGWSLEFESVTRAGLAATRAVVRVPETGVVRTFAHVIGLLEEARLPERVHRRALAAFRALAEVEGRLHRRPVAQVHFHELGGHDTVIDVVGTACALEVLGVEEVAASAVATGSGVVRSSHGLLPNPSPAVVSLLKDAPIVGLAVPVELTTPTGAALLAAWATGFGPMPAMVVEASGYGAGARELDGIANCTQVVLGRRVASSAEGSLPPGQPLALLETNLDDVTGETLAHAIGALLEHGAYDAWATPVLMKKGRPGHLVSVLCEPSDAARLRALLEAETGTLGVRGLLLERWAAPREVVEVEVFGYPVRVKVTPRRAKAEHADAARVARALRRPLREVVAAAEAAWEAQRGTPEDGGREPGGDGSAS